MFLKFLDMLVMLLRLCFGVIGRVFLDSLMFVEILK